MTDRTGEANFVNTILEDWIKTEVRLSHAERCFVTGCWFGVNYELDACHYCQKPRTQTAVDRLRAMEPKGLLNS